MLSKESFSLMYKNSKLNPKADDLLGSLFSDEDVQKAFKIDAENFDDITEENSAHFTQGKHFIVHAYQRYWSKKGLTKLAFFMDSDAASDFIEFLEELNKRKKEVVNSFDTTKIVDIYKVVEDKFVQYAKKIEDSDDVDSNELKKFVESFDMFVNLHKNLDQSTKASQAPQMQNDTLAQKNQDKGGFLQGVYSALTNGSSDTKNSAYDFATNGQKDAFSFTTKTEDDAYNFASKMEDDAYNFVSKMADDAYKFADKGMDYGYMFTSQGEELGPMADRILWMASEIGLMSDRIGEMSDRIVHTEHLIVNTSVMILNFGLLIDGTIKTIAESGLHALGMVFDKDEVPKLESSNKHLDMISTNVQTIITQQHEYDMKVLENQKELRKITISALDKIPKPDPEMFDKITKTEVI